MNDKDQLNSDMSNDFWFSGNGNLGNKIMRKDSRMKARILKDLRQLFLPMKRAKAS